LPLQTLLITSDKIREPTRVLITPVGDGGEEIDRVVTL